MERTDNKPPEGKRVQSSKIESHTDRMELKRTGNKMEEVAKIVEWAGRKIGNENKRQQVEKVASRIRGISRDRFK